MWPPAETVIANAAAPTLRAPGIRYGVVLAAAEAAGLDGAALAGALGPALAGALGATEPLGETDELGATEDEADGAALVPALAEATGVGDGLGFAVRKPPFPPNRPKSRIPAKTKTVATT